MSYPKLTTHWHCLERDHVRALQGRKLHRYLRDSVLPFSKHYQAVFAQAGLTADDIRTVDDLAKIPFSTKEELLPTPDNPRKALEFVLVPDPAVLRRRPSTLWTALRRGPARARDELDREWRPTFMTATTGRSTESVAFLYSQHDIAHLGLGSGRIAELGGRTRDDRMLNMFPFAPHLAFWYMYYSGIDRNIFCLSTGGGKVMGTEGNLRAMQRIRPTVISGMPTFIYHVLSEAVNEGLRIEGLKCVLLGGEKVAEGTRRKLAELCAQVGSPDVVVVATYGFTEAKLAWSECPFTPGMQPSGYHLYPDLGIFEVIDPETGKVQPDSVGGELVYTPLDQRGTVILRYRTGDHIEHGITYEPCPYCGKRMPRLMGRISRVSDFRSMRFQKVKGTIVDFNELEHALDDQRGLGSWVLELRKVNDDPLDLDEITLHVTKACDLSDETLHAQISNMLHSHFEVRPNKILFQTPEKMRELQQVGVALKERKVVDNRPKATAAPHQPPPAPAPKSKLQTAKA